ncbi:MAG: Crp/Fnr family transcriptional regulator [Pseudolabrys sp.]|jgi:CRP-like cAMP-binding protein
MAKSPNSLLASLPADVFSALSPHLKLVELKFGDVLAETGGAVRKVYFPYSGVISLVVELDVGSMIETAMVGRDGVLSAAAALDGKVSLNKGVVQLAGSAGVMEVDQLRRLAKEFEPFREILIRHEQVLFAQSQQSAACNASHTVEARMCRWLLHMRDFAGGDDLLLTQEFLAQMLGVRRTSVTVVASPLRKAGLIDYTRGRIRLRDVEGLKKEACECYATVKAHYQRLLSD